MENQVNDIALMALTCHRSPNGATHTKWANTQSQDLTPLPNAAIAANQIISVSGVHDMYILNPVSRGSKFSRVRKNAGDDRRSRRDGILLSQKLGHC